MEEINKAYATFQERDRIASLGGGVEKIEKQHESGTMTARELIEYTPKLGSLTMEDIVATDAQFAGCYFDGLPEQPIERVSMKNVTITFDPNAEAGQAAMADNRPLVKKLAIYAENVKEIDLHNVKIEGYEGERLHFANVGHFEED